MPAAMLLMTLLAGLAMLSILGAQRSITETEPGSTLVHRLDALLPQTQCGRCTYAGCLPYAHAIAQGEADTNQCPPGGARTAAALARLMGREPKPVDPAFGVVPAVPFAAWIDEAACIGCTKCIQACPVDAIVGASRYMHTVISAHCTGCELCVPSCPVDCIEMRPPPAQPRQRSS
ncbi:electron transporter RnfB [Steroidobacter denitrificans]|uniref:Electron transporter RnfB n=1 Tax=Steroidobacter denitrificans TaxID=465721 RepID=A0A127F9L2_STEDE|nr:electron transporter RnfB [Steroidobacter denitrificans]